MPCITFEKYKIGELGKVITGRTPPSSKPECFGEEYPFITPGDMHDRKKANTTDRYLSEDGANLLKNNLIPSGSIAVSCIGWQMGKSIMVTRPSFTNQQLNTVIPNKKVDPDYLYYSLVTRRNEFFSLGSGVGVRTPILNKSAFSNLEILLPSLKQQKKIAEVLTVYDNLIENNNRRIAILEEMAKSLYREWFIKFRFPDFENTKFIDSPLGKIPEGWEVEKLKNVCHLTMGQSPKSEFYNENEDGLPFFQGVKDFGQRFPRVRVWCSKPTRLAHAGDVLFSVRAPVGRLNIADQEISIGRGLCAIRHKNEMQSFLLQQLKSTFTSEDMIGNGAIFASVTKKDMEDIKLVTPKDRYIAEFCESADPIFKQLNNLSKKNKVLKSQRDLLLPKLISGKINLNE